MKKIKILVRGLISSLFFSTILFLSGGKLGYIQGWIFLATNIITTLLHFLVFPDDKDLIDERSSVKEMLNPGISYY